MKQERVFVNAPEAVATARRYVAGQLRDVPRAVVDEIAIMVSELATNCIRHTTSDFSVAVEAGTSRIVVEVTDRGSGTPNVRSPGPQEPSGRGLLIVRELSDSFGFRELPGAPGKTVWFVVELANRSPERTGTEATA